MESVGPLEPLAGFHFLIGASYAEEANAGNVAYGIGLPEDTSVVNALPIQVLLARKKAAAERLDGGECGVCHIQEPFHPLGTLKSVKSIGFWDAQIDQVLLSDSWDKTDGTT